MTRKIPIFIIPSVIIIASLLNIESVIAGMKNAIEICISSVIPSLFIFMVLSDMTASFFIASDIKIPPKAISFILGALCGFPIGASTCSQLYEKGLLNKKECEKIIPYCNNAGPAFIIGAIGSSMLHNKTIGILLFLAQTISSFILLLPTRIKKAKIKENKVKIHIFDTFLHAIESSTLKILKICGLICFFTAVLSLLQDTVFSYAALILEISCASSLCSNLFKIHPYIAMLLLGFSTGFSGICVHMQILSVAKNTDMKFLPLFYRKIIQGIVCSLISFGLYYFFGT